MSNFKKVGGRYGFHSGSGRVKNFQVDGDLFVQGNSFPVVGEGKVWYVDGDLAANGDGTTWSTACNTIQSAINNAGAGDVIFVTSKTMAAGATDPSSYAETLTIAAAKSNLSLIGVDRGRTQGGLPQISKGSGAVALLTIRAPGCLIANLGFNGAGSTGGGILLDDDGLTKSAFGTTIIGCHFKNCKGSSATDASTGGAIQWSSAGNAWQVYIAGNRFYKNVGDIVLMGTSGSVPQDVVIEDNIFSGPSANVDCNLYLGAGSGMNGVIIRNNDFTAVPAVGLGTNVKFLMLTGCFGELSGNRFASNGRTFGAAGNDLVPTTVFLAANYQEKSTSGSGEIFRT